MKITSILSIASAIVTFAACTSSVSQQSIIPLTKNNSVEDTYTIVWNGSSTAYRFEDEKWERAENYDYLFSVVQKRYGRQWKSIKNMHRLHPDYDGKAGDRNQTMYFEINYQPESDSLTTTLNSSLGNGFGHSDLEFRNQTMEFEVEDISRFAPYDHIRITQHYQYEKGMLEETVLLFKKKDGQEIPFMKNEEKAFFYTKGRISEAPTRFLP